MAARRRATPARQKKFLESLAVGASLEKAALDAGCDRRAFYDLRFDADGHLTDFGREVVDAIDRGNDVLEDEVRRRGYEGVLEPVISGGRLAKNDDGTPMMVRRYSDTLLIFMLKARRPEKFRDNHRVEHTGADGAPLEVKLTFQPDPALAERLREH